MWPLQSELRISLRSNIERARVTHRRLNQPKVSITFNLAHNNMNTNRRVALNDHTGGPVVDFASAVIRKD